MSASKSLFIFYNSFSLRLTENLHKQTLLRILVVDQVPEFTTAIPRLTLLMDPACLACNSKLRIKGINYIESRKMKS